MFARSFGKFVLDMANAESRDTAPRCDDVAAADSDSRLTTAVSAVPLATRGA